MRPYYRSALVCWIIAMVSIVFAIAIFYTSNPYPEYWAWVGNGFTWAMFGFLFLDWRQRRAKK